jgi:hypothetical protein
MATTDAEHLAATAAEPLATIVDRLRSERDGLREAMRTRALIEQAKGVLMARHWIDGDAAFERLRTESQRSNVRVAEVAAGVVARVSPDSARCRTPAPDAADDAEPGSADVYAHPPVPAGDEPDGEDVRARFLLTAARIRAATDPQEIVAAVGASRLDWPAPSSVVLTLVEPDGALRLVASRGIPAETASQWTRIPPQVEVPLTGAARAGTPVLLSDPEQVREAYPLVEAISRTAGALAALPVVHGGRLIGVLGVSWHESVLLEGPRRHRLLGIANAAARAVWRAHDRSSVAAAWVQALLDGSLTPAAVLLRTPDGADFLFERTNEAAEAGAARYGHRLAGTTVLTAAPDLGARELVGLYRRVLADGRPRQLDDAPVAAPGGTELVEYRTHRAVRLGERILATWRSRPGADLAYDDLVAAGRLTRVASFRLHLPSRALLGTPNLRAVLGWPAGRELTPATVRRAFDASHWPAVRAAAAATLRDGVPMVVVALAGTGRRRLLIRAERVADDLGRPVALRGAVHALPPAVAARGRRMS